MKLNDIKNISEIVSYQANIRPHKIAIYTENMEITYRELNEYIINLSSFLYLEGIRPNDVIGLIFYEEYISFITMLAVSKIGATAFCISKSDPEKLREKNIKELDIKKILSDMDYVKEKNYLKISKEILIRESHTFLDKEYIDCSDIPWIFISGSGSTGKSKIIPVTNKQQIKRAKASIKWLSNKPNDKLFSLVDIEHYSSKVLYIQALISGSSSILLNRNKLNLFEIYDKYKITVCYLTVFHIEKILKNLPIKHKKMGFIRALIIDGSTVSNNLRKRISEYLTENIFVRYGINEVGTVTVSKPPLVYTSSNTVGFPIPSVELQIVDNNKNILKFGDVGEIRIKSEMTIDKYYNDKESTNKVIKDGWFYPKDLGLLNKDGELIYMGRSDHMMIMNGINIYPAQIEQTMLSHPSVSDVSVIPIKSKIHQDIPVCAIVLNIGSNEDEEYFLKYCRDRIGIRSAKKIVFLDTIPKNEHGKIIRTELTKIINQKLFKKLKIKNTGISNSKLIEYAKNNDIPIIPFIENTDYVQFGWGINSRVFQIASPFEDSYHGVKISMDKIQSKKLLKNIGVPIAKHIIIQHEKQLEEVERLVGFPCVVKPIRGAGGEGITTNINTLEDLKLSYKNAKESVFGKSFIMIEKFIEGDDYRLIVSGGKFLAAIRRSATCITGDGKSSVEELVSKVNSYRKTSSSFFKEIKLDQKLSTHLKRYKLSFSSILEKELTLPLSSTANMAGGGEGEDVTNIVHPHLKLMAEQISKASGIDILGVDYITSDITKSYTQTNGKVTEFNHYISLASADVYSNSKYFYEQLLSLDSFRIPIVLLIIKEKEFNFFSNYLQENIKDKNIGWLCNQDVFIGELKLEVSLRVVVTNVEMLLRQRNLEKAIIICSEEYVSKKGLPLDKVDYIYEYDVDISKSIKNRIINASLENKSYESKEDLINNCLNKLNIKLKNSTKKHNNVDSKFVNEKIFSLIIDKNTMPSELIILNRWLVDVLKINIVEETKSKLLIDNISYKILSLATTLFQAIKIPIFNIAKIDKKNYDHKTKIFKIDIKQQIVDNLDIKIFKIIFERSTKIVLEYLNKDINQTNTQKLFRYITNHIINPYKRVSGSGKSTIPVLKEAYNLNIPFKHFGAGVYQLGWGSKARLMDRSTTGFDSAIGAKLAQSKMLTTNLVKEAGLPAPQNKLVSTKIDALKAAQDLGFPVVVKPSDQDRGEGITVGITNKEDLYKAFEIAKKSSRSKKVIVEKQVDGICHRIFIANGKLLYAVKRLPKGIFADGKSSIKELINSKNKNEKESPPWLKTEIFPMDSMTIKVLEELCLTLDDIPILGRFIALRDIESTRWGGTDEDVTNTIHQENIDIAISSARLFGLHVAGVDIISSDITKPWHENAAIINEVNFSPLFGGGEISKKAIPRFLEEFIDGDGRIPIHYFKQESILKAKELQYRKQKEGINCFLVENVENQDKKIKAMLLNTILDEVIVME